MRFALRVAVWLLAAPALAHAWSSLGHEVTCEIAFQELTPRARTEVLALVRADREFRTFASACTWADRVRDDASFDWLKPYHFVNVPRTATRVSMRRDCRPEGCVLAGIDRFSRVLRNPSSSRAQALEALKILGHLVADLHQPLHVSFEDDLGGNRIGVTFFDERTTLHGVWDFGLLDRGERDARRLGGALQRTITGAQRARWRAGTPIDWANESLAVARDPATGYVGAPRCCARIGEDYYEANWPRAHERLRQGGYRLAVLLNGIWAGE